MKNHIFFSNRNWKHELRLESERQNELREADITKETSRAVDAENELLKRLKGISEKSDSRNDSFKFLGYDTFTDKDKGYDYDAFNSTLDGLLYDNSVVGFNSGYFRTRVHWCEVEIRNIVRSNQDQIIIQVVSGAIKIDSAGKLIGSNNDYKILYRKHSNGSWSDWKEYVATSSGNEAQKTTEEEIVEMGFTKNQGTITGVKMNGESKGTFGVVDLGRVITEHQDISGKANTKDLAVVATSGSYNDLSDKPTIPSAVTESTVSEWGFTKNEGTVTEVKVNGAIKTPVNGVVELPELATQEEFDPYKEKLDTVESGANKYVHPNEGEGSNGSYAAFNPETLVGAEKITVPTMTVNRFGHVTSAGVNEIKLPDFTKYATGITKDDLVAGVVNGTVDISDFFDSTQPKLFSGVNIKTINGKDILGNGNIEISGGSSEANVKAVDTTDSVDDPDIVPYIKYVAQTLTDEQKAQARENIGASPIIDLSTVASKTSISILFVGNSLTQDGIAYLPYMFKTYYPEIDFKIYMWYIGGKTLGDHYSTFTSGGKADIFSVAENSASWTNNSKNTTMASVLSTYKFDIVCMQEYFNYKTSYEDCADWDNCRNYILTNYKGGNPLKFISLFHAPLRKDGYDVNEVYKRTEDGNALILQSTISEDIIPNGIAVYRALDTDLNSLGDLGQLSPDGTHTQEGLPCLLQTWVTLLWVFDKLGINKSIYGHPMRMTTAIYNSISVPGANLGKGVVQGTDAQNILAQEVAIKAYKEGKQFLMRNLYPYNWESGAVTKQYTFTITTNVNNATIKINGIEQSSIVVYAGTTVNWEVSKDGYHTQTGSAMIVKDTTLNVVLVPSAELLSITAEFNQGERTIFNEDGFDELRKFLVVTKEYNNGMMEVTEDYELSGELVGGTNTISVSVGEKSTTFNVEITEVVIPSSYVRYGYIQKKTNDKSQVSPDKFIYLGEYEDYNTLSMEVNLGLKSSSSSDTSGMLGSRLAEGSGINYYAIYWTSGSGEIKVRMRNVTNVYPVATTETFARIIVDNKEISPLTIQVNDGEAREYTWTDSYVIPHPMCLFNNIPNGSTSSYYVNRDTRIGEMKFRKYNGECVAYYIPVVDSSGKIGMYDVMSQTFYTAATASVVTTSNSGCLYSVGNW